MSMNRNKDAMINDLNEQILHLQQKIKELDGKIAEYEKQMDQHKEEYESKHLETVDIAWSLLEENVKLHDELLKRKKIKVKEEKCEPIKMTDEEWKQYFDDLLR